MDFFKNQDASQDGPLHQWKRAWEVRSKSREMAAASGSRPRCGVVTHFWACHFPSCCWQSSLLDVCVQLSFSFSWENLSNLLLLLSLHFQTNLLEPNGGKKKKKWSTMRGFEFNGLPVPQNLAVCGAVAVVWRGLWERKGQTGGPKEQVCNINACWTDINSKTGSVTPAPYS